VGLTLQPVLLQGFYKRRNFKLKRFGKNCLLVLLLLIVGSVVWGQQQEAATPLKPVPEVLRLKMLNIARKYALAQTDVDRAKQAEQDAENRKAAAKAEYDALAMSAVKAEGYPEGTTFALDLGADTVMAVPKASPQKK
jgi:hypothetical protein